MRPSSRVTTNSPGSSIADPADVPRAKNSTHSDDEGERDRGDDAHRSGRNRDATELRRFERV